MNHPLQDVGWKFASASILNTKMKKIKNVKKKRKYKLYFLSFSPFFFFLSFLSFFSFFIFLSPFRLTLFLSLLMVACFLLLLFFFFCQPFQPTPFSSSNLAFIAKQKRTSQACRAVACSRDRVWRGVLEDVMVACWGLGATRAGLRQLMHSLSA